MNTAASKSRWLVLLSLIGACLGAITASATTATVYATRFETTEGFSPSMDLTGQGGWSGIGSGGNGIVSNFFEGYGQQAYIGFSPPSSGFTSLGLWKPLTFDSSNASVMRFTVDMSLIDSSTTNRDEFYWAVYNRAGQRLFALLFDNKDLSIWHELDNNTLYNTGWSFVNGDSTNGFYTLDVSMSFSSNRWSAFLNGTKIVTNQLITTKGATLNFGDVDVEWWLSISNKPGDNYLLFDNYAITAEPLPAVIPSLQPPVAAGAGQQLLRVYGKNNVQYALEASTNLVTWTPLKTNIVTGGFFDHLDTGAAALKQRFYRARWVP